VTELFVRLQNIVPQHALSRLVGRLAASRSRFIARPFIQVFSRIYGVSLAEARRKSLDEYASFNDFFTRELVESARPLPLEPDALVSPADGYVSQAGRIERDALIQAKGIRYETSALLDDSAAARAFDDGWFSTIYLAPPNYHRVHVPFDGRLVRAIALPGALFSVNARTEAGVPGLFHRNERLVCLFETSFGPMAVVMVGAMIVASIETSWSHCTSPYMRRQEERPDRVFGRGAELGRFCLGSTVIVLTPRGAVTPIAGVQTGRPVRMGETIARIRREGPETR
jgi:phosphatidylserine decarboxylase